MSMSMSMQGGKGKVNEAISKRMKKFREEKVVTMNTIDTQKMVMKRDSSSKDMGSNNVTLSNSNSSSNSNNNNGTEGRGRVPGKRLQPPPLPSSSSIQEGTGDAWERLLDATLRSNSIACFWCLKVMVVKKLGVAFNRWRVMAAFFSISSSEKMKYENDLKALIANSITFTHSLAREVGGGDPNPNRMSPLTNASSIHASPKGDLVTIKKRILEQNNIRSSSPQGSYTDEGGDFNDIDTAEIDRHAVMTKEYLDSKNAISGADLTEEELELRRYTVIVIITIITNTNTNLQESIAGIRSGATEYCSLVIIIII